MKQAIQSTYFLLLLALIVNACTGKETDKYPIQQADWESKQTSLDSFDHCTKGQTYLPLYSHIYHIHEHRTFDLTITVSMRNVSPSDTVYILHADYYNTLGENIRQYIDKPIYIKPLETIEIVIEEQDIDGGSGANFVFDWAAADTKNPPLFEAVMISTHGQQGLSFITRGVQIIQ
ncbi:MULTISPECIES: DUF3124 domain-containing protein [unclassified Carboxylicivirga]|uniref:DUF3124 domain-containing protein n=1 Tax=Carboxylicivirga TaxID=1628153 RepID=UPI003D329E16